VTCTVIGEVGKESKKIEEIFCDLLSPPARLTLLQIEKINAQGLIIPATFGNISH